MTVQMCASSYGTVTPARFGFSVHTELYVPQHNEQSYTLTQVKRMNYIYVICQANVKTELRDFQAGTSKLKKT